MSVGIVEGNVKISVAWPDNKTKILLETPYLLQIRTILNHIMIKSNKNYYKLRIKLSLLTQRNLSVSNKQI